MKVANRKATKTDLSIKLRNLGLKRNSNKPVEPFPKDRTD